MRRTRGGAALFLAVCLVLVACGAEQPVASRTTSDEPAGPPVVPSESATLSATPAPDAAPPDLAGTWRRNLAGVEILLTFQDTGYLIRRGGNMGSGTISVDGHQIVFSGSALCDGIGTYTWAIDEGRLRLTEVEEPCTGRSDALLLGTFGAVDE
jgi:hypothetical protein